MRKAIKIIAGLIGLLIILAIAAVVCLVTFVNPNDFKDQISTKVAAYTGRELTINGEIKWSFFPWLGMQLNQVSLSNAKGFGTQPFAHIDHADVKVQLVPLLSGQVKIGKLGLDGLQLNLMKNAQGVTNWQDLTAQAKSQAANDNDPPADASTKSNNKASRNLKFAIEGIDISNSNISWQNQQNGQNINITKFAMTTGQLSLAKPFPLSMQFNINSNQPSLNGDFNLKSDVTGDLANQTYSLKDLKLTSTLNNKSYANGKLGINLLGNVNVDLTKQTLIVDSLDAKIANLQVQGDLQGQQILSNLQLQGHIKIPSFNLKQLMAALGHPLPARKDQNAFNLVSASGNLQATTNSFRLSQLTAQLDSTQITGSLAVTDFSKKALAFDANIDQINVDNYLAAQPTVTTASNGFIIQSAHAAPQQASNQSLLPVDTLRQLNMQGRLKIGKLHLNKLDASAINMQLNAQNGLLNLAPISAKLYDGTYNGNIKIDVRNKTPLITMSNQLSGIQIEPLTHDMINIIKLQMTGAGNLNMDITTQGNTEAAIIKSLNGKGRLALNNGILKGINIPYYVRVGRALINQSSMPARGPNQTEFGNLTGTFTINNGVVDNRDLLIVAPTFQAKGSGTANLLTQHLDYRLIVQLLVTGTKEPQGDAIPINVRGNFDDVSVHPDVESIAKQKIGSAVTNELQKRLGDETGKAIGNAVNTFLNQLGQ